MTNLTEFTFLSSDGKTRLHAMQWLTNVLLILLSAMKNLSLSIV